MSQSEASDQESANHETPGLAQPISVAPTRDDQNRNSSGTTGMPNLVTIPAEELQMLRDIANAVRAGRTLAARSSTESSGSQNGSTKFSTKNMKIEKFDPESNKRLMDYGLTRWLEQFNRELEFEFKAQSVEDDEDIKKMTLYRYMKGKAATYVRQMAATFSDMTYCEVQNQLKEKYKKNISVDKRQRMIANCRRHEGEDGDDYLTRLITIADSMPEGTSLPSSRASSASQTQDTQDNCAMSTRKWKRRASMSNANNSQKCSAH